MREIGMDKVFYLMRHGQTLFNQRHKIQGVCDSPLTEEGKEQARLASKYFDDKEIDSAYSSSSERACDTLEIVLQGKLPYQRLKGLKEWNFGVFEGESEDLNPKGPYLDYWKQFGGEGQEEVALRMTKTLEKIAETDKHEHILCLTHGGAMFAFFDHWKAYDKIEFSGHMSNCCILRYEYDGKAFYLTEVHTLPKQ